MTYLLAMPSNLPLSQNKFTSTCLPIYELHFLAKGDPLAPEIGLLFHVSHLVGHRNQTASKITPVLGLA